MRFHGFDYLRAFGMLAVIYIHGCDTNDVARLGMKWLGFAVPCFFLMSAFLTQTSLLRKPVAPLEFARTRLIRLGRPLLVWSAVYLAVRFAKATLAGETLDTNLFGVLFWGDASHQLYFVPLLIYFTLAWFAPMLLARSRPLAVAICCLVVAATLIVFEGQIAAWLPSHRWFVAPNLAWFPIGIVAALTLQRWPDLSNQLFWPGAVVAAGLVLSDTQEVHAYSVALFVAALGVRDEAPSTIRFLARLSFGAYLAHVLVIETLQYVSPRLGIPLESFAVTLGVIGLATASYGLCEILSRFQSTRWCVQ